MRWCEDQEQGGRAIAVAADVSQAADVAEMVDHVAFALAPIDILVNNAGMAIVRGIDDLTGAISTRPRRSIGVHYNARRPAWRD